MKFTETGSISLCIYHVETSLIILHEILQSLSELQCLYVGLVC